MIEGGWGRGGPGAWYRDSPIPARLCHLDETCVRQALRRGRARATEDFKVRGRFGFLRPCGERTVALVAGIGWEMSARFWSAFHNPGK